MKRCLVTGLSLLSLLSVSSAFAQWEPGATLLSMNLGYATAKSTVSGKSINAGTVSVTLDYVIPDEVMSFGIGWDLISADENAFLELGGQPPQTTEVRYNSSSFYGTCKGWFGGTTVRGYLGGGAGFHTTSVETSQGSDYRITTATGFAVVIPGGVVWFVGDEVYLSGNANVRFLGDSFYDNNVAYAGTVGLGFKL